MMGERAADECRVGEEHCITCGDEGISMRVIELRDGTAVCADQERARHHVAVDFVEPVAIGDELLVHAGVAIRHLSDGVHA
jgi:hydrogenase maturation factor